MCEASVSRCQPGEYTDDFFALSQPAETTVMTVQDKSGEGDVARWASVPNRYGGK